MEGEKTVQTFKEAVARFRATKDATAEVMSTQIPIPRALKSEEIEKINNFPLQNLVIVSDEDLMRYYNLLVGFQSYADWERSKADIERSTAKSVKEFTMDRAEDLAPEKLNDRQKKRWVKLLQEVVDNEQVFLECDARFKLLTALEKGYSEKVKLCSRELSRRLKDKEAFLHSKDLTT